LPVVLIIMKGAPMPAPNTLAAKLDRLFAATRPAGRGEHSYEEVAKAIRDAGGSTVSSTYLWMLRTGQRDNPTKKHLEALAAHFGVPVAYFFDDEVAAAVDRELVLLAAMRDNSVRTVALRSAGLSGESLDAIAAMIEHARRLEGLPSGTDT